MPLLIRRHRINPRGRNLDLARPLFVTRRIPGGVDWLPGEAFDPKGLPKLRLEALFRGRYIGHELPRGVKAIAAVPAPVIDPPVPVVEPLPEPPKPGKRPRAGA